jgi:hypothetical protein
MQLIDLPHPFTLKAGSELDLSAYIPQLITYPTAKVVDYEIRAPKMPRPGIPSDDWTGESVLADNPDFPPSPVDAAFDGDPNSRWTTGGWMQPGDTVTIDFHKTYSIRRVVLDSAGSKNDYPRGCTISVSTDGKTWQKAAEMTEEDCVQQQKEGVLEISFAPTDARFLKIVQNGHVEGAFWSIHELYVFE